MDSMENTQTASYLNQIKRRELMNLELSSQNRHEAIFV